MQRFTAKLEEQRAQSAKLEAATRKCQEAEVMSPLLQQVLQEIEQLTPEEQLEVISYTTEQLKQQAVTQANSKRSWKELRGIAPNILNGQDAQEWVNQLRREWGEREKQIFKES